MLTAVRHLCYTFVVSKPMCMYEYCRQSQRVGSVQVRGAQSSSSILCQRCHSGTCGYIDCCSSSTSVIKMIILILILSSSSSSSSRSVELKPRYWLEQLFNCHRPPYTQGLFSQRYVFYTRWHKSEITLSNSHMLKTPNQFEWFLLMKVELRCLFVYLLTYLLTYLLIYLSLYLSIDLFIISFS